MREEYEKLPDNWQEMSLLDKDKWFARNYVCYLREGETDGLYDFAPEEVKKAYKEFLDEKMAGD